MVSWSTAVMAFIIAGKLDHVSGKTPRELLGHYSTRVLTINPKIKNPIENRMKNISGLFLKIAMR